MAPPHGEAAAVVTAAYPARPTKNFSKPPRLSNDNLKRTVSDIAYELSKGMDLELELELEDTKSAAGGLPPISEAEDAKCECCGMSEEYTPEYIRKVREKYLGKWICGLCCEAVKEEMEKNGDKCTTKEALETHMSHCVRFNKLGRAYPVLCQAEAMREILKKSCRVRAKSTSPRDHLKAGPIKKGGISRSSSCMPAMMNNLSLQ